MARRKKVKKWVQKAHLSRGGLHRSLGYPMGKRIPTSVIRAAAKRPGKVGKQARLALTFAKMRRRKKVRRVVRRRVTRRR